MIDPYSKESDWKIKDVGSVFSQEIKSYVLGFYEEWLLDTSRQEQFTTHENTFMYELINFNYAWRPGSAQTSKTVNKFVGAANEELSAIYKYLEDYSDGKVIHAEVISMKPKSRIRVHKDRGDMLYLARRFHVPLKTNSQTFFIVEDEQFFLEEGKAYELNNVKYHGVRNNSEEIRIHLIIDIIPNEYLDKVIFE
jgi:hypothetical protein